MKQRLFILFTTTMLFPCLTTAALISATATELTAPTINSNSSATAVSVNAEAMELIGSDVRARSSANQSGELKVYSSNDGGQQMSSEARWQQLVTNTTGTASSYQLDFSTGLGRIGFSSHTDPSDGSLFGATGSSGYNIEVILNGTSIWQSSAKMSEFQGPLAIISATERTRSVYSFSQSGVDLGGILDLQDWSLGDTFVPSSYKFDPTSFTLNLGNLLDGESLTVTYLLHSYANQTNLALTAIGAGSFASISASSISEVPLPATLPLLFSAIFGFSIFARRNPSKS